MKRRIAPEDDARGPGSGPGAGSRSPLVDKTDLAELTAQADVLPAPGQHTEAELAAMLALLRKPTGPRERIGTVAIGHGRDDASRAAAHAFAAEWRAQGGHASAVVDWPESAASWLRPANRLSAGAPDAWVVAAGILGFAQLARRLRHSTDWDPARTFAFASLQDPRLPALAGPETLHGLRGVTARGGTWEVRGRWIVEHGDAGSR